MKTKYSPVIRLGDLIDAGLHPDADVARMAKIKYLCLPLLPSARKKMVEAMAIAQYIAEDPSVRKLRHWLRVEEWVREYYIDYAKAGLAALEALPFNMNF